MASIQLTIGSVKAVRSCRGSSTPFASRIDGSSNLFGRPGQSGHSVLRIVAIQNDGRARWECAERRGHSQSAQPLGVERPEANVTPHVSLFGLGGSSSRRFRLGLLLPAPEVLCRASTEAMP